MSQNDRQLESYKLTLHKATVGLMAPRDQKRLITLIVSRTRHQTYLFAFFVAVLVFAVWFIVGNMLPESLLMMFGLGCFLFATLLINKRRSPIARRMLSKTLCRKGIRPNFCLRCLYDLKGSISEQCPECGEKLAPVSDPEQNSEK